MSKREYRITVLLLMSVPAVGMILMAWLATMAGSFWWFPALLGAIYGIGLAVLVGIFAPEITA